jgi:hypothetical protein
MTKHRPFEDLLVLLDRTQSTLSAYPKTNIYGIYERTILDVNEIEQDRRNDNNKHDIGMCVPNNIGFKLE